MGTPVAAGPGGDCASAHCRASRAPKATRATRDIFIKNVRVTWLLYRFVWVAEAALTLAAACVMTRSIDVEAAKQAAWYSKTGRRYSGKGNNKPVWAVVTKDVIKLRTLLHAGAEHQQLVLLNCVGRLPRTLHLGLTSAGVFIWPVDLLKQS